MRLHGRLDDPGGQLQEALVEAPLEDDRALDEEDHLLDDPGRVTPAADAVQALEDLAPAFLLLRLDARGPQRLDVGIGLGQLDLVTGEAVTVGQVPGLDAGHLEPDRLLVELGAEPADGPREAQAVLLPDHRLAEAEPAHDRLEPLGQGLGDRPARNDHAEEAVSHLEVVLGDPLLAREAGGGFLPQMLRRPLHPAIGLALGDLGNEKRDPAAARRARFRPPPARAASARGAALRPRGRRMPAAPRSRSQTAGSARDSRSFRRRCERACERDRCRRRARSPRSPRARRAG